MNEGYIVREVVNGWMVNSEDNHAEIYVFTAFDDMVAHLKATSRSEQHWAGEKGQEAADDPKDCTDCVHRKTSKDILKYGCNFGLAAGEPTPIIKDTRMAEKCPDFKRCGA